MEIESMENVDNKQKFIPNLILQSDEKPKPDKILHERYWTSWEEEKLIELWCKYQNEIIELDENTPIFRTIADDMKDFGFYLTTRECRRRMLTLKNKYISEKRRIDVGPYDQAPFRLYALIDCLLEARVEKPNAMHEDMVIDELFAEMKVENPSYLTESKDKKNDEKDIFKGALQCAHAPKIATINPRTCVRPTSIRHLKSFVPIRRVTPHLLQEIRADIRRLEQERDYELRRLRLEQNDYYSWVALFQQAQRQLEDILTRLQTERQFE